MPKANVILSQCWPDVITKRYHDRQQVFLEGDEKRWAYLVEAGTVSLYKTLPDGKRQVFGFGFRHAIIGLEATETYSLSAQAIGITRLKCVPYTALCQLAAKDAAFALQLYEAVSAEVEATRDLVVILSQHGSTERVANFLLTLARRKFGSSAHLIALPMNRLDIADFLGMKIETVSRALAKLVQSELIEVLGRSKIQIKDMAGLQRLAGLANHVREVSNL